MKITPVITASVVMLGAVCFSVAVMSGCDTKPHPPGAGLFGGGTDLQIAPDDAAEYEVVLAMEHARAIYEARLIALHSYYLEASHIHKTVWAFRELANLRDAKAFQWQDATIPPAVDTPTPPDAPEGAMVERVVEARLAYQRQVDTLARYYEQSRQDFKASAIRNMEARLDPIRTYLYISSAEYPPLTLRPRDDIPEANALFSQAVTLFRQGKGFTRTALTTNYRKQREALRLFLELVQNYPTSSKIALSAYYIAEIYKEYFDENLRAVNWYERAYTWLPTLNEPARFQAATVYDIRLNDKIRAIELYQAAIEREPFNRSNAKFAIQRIGELYAEAEMQRQLLRQMGIEP